MVILEEQVVVLKNQGNKVFVVYDWLIVIDFYFQVIELNDKELIFWLNRVQVGSFQEFDVIIFFVLLIYVFWYVKQVYMKIEVYGYVIRDVMKVIELNLGMIKVYYC